MEISIKEKFNDFIKLIENQKNESSNNFNAEIVINNCLCSLTSDSENSAYIFEKKNISNELNNINLSEHNKYCQNTDDKLKSSKDYKDITDNNKDITNNNKDIADNNKNITDNNKDITNNNKDITDIGIKKYKDLFDLALERDISNDNVSLLDDNTIIIKEVKNKLYNIDNNTISSESKEILDNNKKIRSKFKFENDEDELEHLFNKIIKKRNEKKIELMAEKELYVTTNNIQNIKIDTKNSIEEIINENKNDISIIFNKVFKIIYNNVFIESTRGWNTQNNIYVMNFDILKKNLTKIDIGQHNNLISIGYIYRDFENPKSFIDKDIYNYWININLTKNIVTNNNVKAKSKLLISCIKNLEKSSKFKKRIGQHYYKCLKKKVQVYGNKNIFVEIIFYIKYLAIS